MKNQGLLATGLSMVMRNKRYIIWFWVLNLTLAEFATGAFRRTAHGIMDHSLYANRLLPSIDFGTVFDLFSKPDFGSFRANSTPSYYFAFLFFLATAIFLPGVFAGYASTYRLPREEFFRACGRNLWRFIRIMTIAGIIMGVVAGLLFWANGAIADKANESTNEKLPFQLRMTGFAIIFLIMTILRIWFDLAETDTVLSDQRAVRTSIAAGFQHTFANLGRLLGSYLVSTLVAAVVLCGGLWLWMKLVAPTNVIGAFLIIQIILFLLLIPRFWQRGIAAAYWQEHMVVPVFAVQPIETTPATVAPAPLFPVPDPSPVITASESPSLSKPSE